MNDSRIVSSEELFSELRYGRPVLLQIDNSAGSAKGLVVAAAELCTPEHITFMARKARGLVCLGLTAARCQQLSLPLMVEGDEEAQPFTLSIEASTGIDTGISAVDRARTVRVAVAQDATPSDLVQPGHIFPIAAVEGGVLNRVDSAEATTDLAACAGLMPAAVFAEVLDPRGEVAEGNTLLDFASEHGLKVGRVSDLVHFRLANECTVERIREGSIDTAHGAMQLTVYREHTQGRVHLALSRGEIREQDPTVVRVHVTSTLRDLVGTTLSDRASWRFDDSLQKLAGAERAVLVLISRPETPDELLAGVDRLLGNGGGDQLQSADGYASVGLGAQILRDLGVGQIQLLSAPVKYNALSGFGLEVVDFVNPGMDH
ncbi:riboflavin biosynthesis protein ribAB [Luminiphilus syltensis NOR5-1B]|uniref:3,4-dihydroxy-2-butanone 4-phosphate synthase n=1 Tax=Luminiphilus syltensis NOR5-1B TaxID=565045 RepID=B8KWB1_9GAMM|nr:3,4-dihydroxy-2-butanone-4-phosphate synthase [Luminiphilus syltensis]EED35400.1 riboflavin biosynthesis protein ribAB [Luminiphilus syltensis NOR5-1B]